MTIRLLATGLVASLALSSVACAPPPPPRRASKTNTTSAKIEPAAPVAKNTNIPLADIDTLLKRETTTPLKDFRVRAGDGALELHVKAVAAPTVKTRKREDGGAYTLVTFSIGAEAEVVCNASSTPLDIAHFAEDVVVNMKLQLSTMPIVRVEAPGSRPLMFIDTDGIFTDAADGKPKRNIAKFAGTHFDTGSVTCVHDGIGYKETFHDLMLHIATRTQAPNAEKPIFRQVSVLTDANGVMGYLFQERWPSVKKGETRESSLSSVMLRDDEHWAAGDSGWYGVSDAKGVVSEQSMRRLGRGNAAVDMKLTRRMPGAYAYEGTVDGVAKKGSFAVRGTLTTSLARAPLFAAFLKDTKKKDVTFFHFDEEQPEKGAIKEIARRTGDAALRLEEDGKAYECTADTRGLLTRCKREGADHSWQSIATDGAL